MTDTQDQTKAVLFAMAAGSRAQGDLSSWKALQVWLQHAEHRVLIPFARRLAELTQPVSVRLRRDFGAVLALIIGHAILHQSSRPREKSGEIVAMLEDYRAVRELVANIVSEGVGSTVSPTVRETVQAIIDLHGQTHETVSLAQLAARLKLDKSAASRRAAVARQLGFVHNEETRKGLPAKYVPGDPLPEEVSVLPTVEALQCCTVEPGIGHPPTPNDPDSEASTHGIKDMSTDRVVEVEI